MIVEGNHGHVTSRPDGMVARCGGPALCEDCRKEWLKKYGDVWPIGLPSTKPEERSCRLCRYWRPVDPREPKPWSGECRRRAPVVSDTPGVGCCWPITDHHLDCGEFEIIEEKRLEDQTSEV